MKNKIFEIVYLSHSSVCDICKEEAHIGTYFHFYNKEISITFCEFHFEQLRNELEKEYDKVKEFSEFKKEKLKEIEEKQKELF